ncbi:MAG: type IV pilus modification protein PilV [Halioglobus sp.]|nr:type IV pilus modification protein PilV [Halioglobus sp.]
MSAVKPVRRSLQAGFTMIEALVTFVVLAIGVLGIVSLMTTSKTAQHEAAQRARAVSMADGMLERIRENPDALASYLRGVGNPVGQGSITSEPSPNCEANVCDPNDMAAHDLWAWEQQMDGSRVTISGAGTTSAGLKEPRGCVTFDNFAGRANTGRLTVRLQWRGLHETSDGVPAVGGVACGGDAAGTDPFRRQVEVSTFVVDEGEL